MKSLPLFVPSAVTRRRSCWWTAISIGKGYSRQRRRLRIKMKAEALNHQGRKDITSGQVVPKSDDNRTTALIGEQTGESYKTVQRYIRLTNLIPELLDLMDEGKIAFSVGVELSFLDDQLQYDVLNACEEADCTPSYAQAVRMHKAHSTGILTCDDVCSILSEEKPNQRDRVVLPRSVFAELLPKNFSKEQAQELIISALKQYTPTHVKKHEKSRSRER